MHLENSVTGKNRNIKQMAQASSQGKGEGGGSGGVGVGWVGRTPPFPI